MNLFLKAFGSEFEPHLDKDAAIKFILNTLLMDRDIERLIELLDISQNVGGIEGEPGWELERVEDKDRSLPGYSEWPNWAYFRAAVDPDFYELSHPEAYYTTEDFLRFVNLAVAAYLETYPEERNRLEDLIALLK
ncbi:MAG: hypothetical protein M8364_18740 [Methylobacter sp.]|uniref:hypothetical protein n=1 Tax=Methylobacter sp. TaxID=2051955 RepID=UPI00258332E8|nr:hypothetical protein [Methylobacter sp.]MCL7422932.1 hypothetical protein [Methylobacter sp.]